MIDPNRRTVRVQPTVLEEARYEATEAMDLPFRTRWRHL